jgi:hypothetical protein
MPAATFLVYALLATLAVLCIILCLYRSLTISAALAAAAPPPVGAKSTGIIGVPPLTAPLSARLPRAPARKSAAHLLRHVPLPVHNAKTNGTVFDLVPAPGGGSGGGGGGGSFLLNQGGDDLELQVYLPPGFAVAELWTAVVTGGRSEFPPSLEGYYHRSFPHAEDNTITCRIPAAAGMRGAKGWISVYARINELKTQTNHTLTVRGKPLKEGRCAAPIRYA